MESLVFFAGLIILLLLIMPIVAYLKANGLARRFEDLRQRVWLLEKQIDDLSHARMATATSAAPESQAARPEDIIETPKSGTEETEAGLEETELGAAEISSGSDPDEEEEDTPDEPASAPSRPDFETAIGTKWTVWVGGLTLALGALFLVKYSVDQGLLSPAVRIILGLAFSALLCAAGEWARRRPGLFATPAYEKANIAAILTAAGSFGLFGSVYAAFALYGFFSPVLAFAALGIIGVATTFAAMLHGPLLATIGLVGSYLTPFLIGSESPNIPALSLYVLAVSAAAMTVARLRVWRWLAAIAGVALVGFAVLILITADSGDQLAYAGFVLAAWAMVFYVFVASFYESRPSKLPKNDWLATSILVLLTLPMAALPALEPTSFVLVVALGLLAIFSYAGTHLWPAARYVVIATAITVVLGYIGWQIPIDDLTKAALGVELEVQPEEFPLPFQLQQSLSLYLSVGAGLGAIGALLGLRGALGSVGRGVLASGGVLLPFLLLAAAYLRIEVLAPSNAFGLAALALGGGYALMATQVKTRLLEEFAGRDHALAAYVIGALAFIALAAAMIFERGVLTLVLGLMVPVTAFVFTRLPVTALKPVALIFAVLWLARIGFDPRIVGNNLGTTPVFNWLLYGYGVPAAGFAYAAWAFGSASRGGWTELMEAVAVATVVGALALLGLHAIDPASVFTPINSLPEAALLTLVGSGVALGLMMLKRTSTSKVLSLGATGLGLLGMFTAIAGLVFAYNPMITGEPVGPGLFFNTLWFAYLLTGALFVLLGMVSRDRRPNYYTRAAFSTGAVLLAAFVTLTIRLGFQPESMAYGRTTDLELYTYSGVWLAIGIATLATGIFRRSKVLRQASAVIIVAVVAKLFLIDMAGLTGILRAFSFVSLGLVLMAIGFVYQRLMRNG